MATFDLHGAIQNYDISKVPADAWTAENIQRRDKVGRTSLQLAAYFGCLDKVPKVVMTAENLDVKDKYGLTLLHSAVASYQLSELPSSFVTLERLLIPTSLGKLLEKSGGIKINNY